MQKNDSSGDVTDEVCPDGEDEGPPFFGSWGRMYAALVALLVVYIALFAWLSEVGR